MRLGTASGFQIAFFTFAVVLLAAPLSAWLLRFSWSPAVAALIDKAIPFAMGAVVLITFPAMRRFCRAELLRPVHPGRLREVGYVLSLKLFFGFAIAGGTVLWLWSMRGPEGLARVIDSLPPHGAEMARAFEPAELARTFIVIGIMAPLIEELVFRGLLYRAWEKQWGWMPAMLASSALFGLYHANFASAFLASIVYVCLLRRTGSLWAPILVHAASNVMLWYPLLGRLVFPRDLAAPGDLATWSFHIACTLAALVILPAYVWLARERSAEEDCDPVELPDGALPR